MNGSPKHAEKVACGSFTPISVPATLAVYPEMKWYAACSGLNVEIGGKTPKASQVRKITFCGWPHLESLVRLSMNSIGYEPLVFWVFEVS